MEKKELWGGSEQRSNQHTWGKKRPSSGEQASFIYTTPATIPIYNDNFLPLHYKWSSIDNTWQLEPSLESATAAYPLSEKPPVRVFCVDRKAQKKSVESLVYSSQPVTVSFKENSNYSWFAFTTKIDVVLLIFENTFGRLRKTARSLTTKQLWGKQNSDWTYGCT